jgi:hypothetical protein
MRDGGKLLVSLFRKTLPLMLTPNGSAHVLLTCPPPHAIFISESQISEVFHKVNTSNVSSLHSYAFFFFCVCVCEKERLLPY